MVFFRPDIVWTMETVSLNALVAGNPSAMPVVILHGLLGSSRNWATILRKWEDRFFCHALDLRNHGSSPHVDSMAYEAMAADVLEYMNEQGIESAAVIGHSMGGKVAMTLACAYPERIGALIVVDMAPKPYPPRWEREFAAMRALPVETFRSRSEAEAALEPDIRDWAFRKFLLTNLARRPEGGFEWSVNLPLLQSCLPDLFAHPLAAEDRYDGPTLFLRGEHSRFVRDDDLPAIQSHFPHARLETVSGAGHNVHFDQPDAFVEAVEALLSSAAD